MRFDDRQSRAVSRQQRRALERKQTKQRRARFIGPLGAALLGTAMFSPTAGAATITVNSTADTVVTGDGACTLREALLNANDNGLTSVTTTDCATGEAAPLVDVIQFSAVTGTITVSPFVPGPPASGGELKITDSVDIQGPGPALLNITNPYTLPPYSAPSNIFRADNSIYGTQIDVTISGLTLNNSTGTAISADENLTVDNVVIDNNNRGGIDVGGSPAVVMVKNSTITNNRANSGAGVFMQRGTMTIDNSNISGNTASGDGGGIVVREGSLTIQNGSTISGNTATYGDGGGVSMYSYSDLDLSVTSSTISGNTAGSDGGGIYFGSYRSNSSFTLTNSTVSGNMTPGRNPGPYFQPGDGAGLRVSASVLSITGSFIQNNISSGSGGGAFLELNKYNISDPLRTFTGPFSITDTTISGNTAGSLGGGVYAYTILPGLTLQNVDVLNNTAGTSVVSGGSGGGLSLSGTSAIADSTITGNRAIGVGPYMGNGGGIYFASASYYGAGVTFTTITTSTIDNNIADREGGGIYVEDGTLSVTNSSVSGNRADGFAGSGSYDGVGGGIFFYDGDLTLTNATISGNTAGTSGVHQGRGGGIYLYDGYFAINSSTVTGNTAFSGAGGYGGKGGGIYLYDGYLDVAGTSISNNVAEEKGGGVYMYGGDLTVTAGSTISGNTAGKSGALYGKGGGVYMYGGYLAIVGSTVTGNTAFAVGGDGGQGGGIYLYNGYLYLTGASVSNNVAEGSGGGIFMDNGHLTTVASSVSANTSGGNGGGIYAYTRRGDIKETTISGNTAAGFGGGLAVERGDFYDFTLENVTVADNTASGGDGGGIHADTYVSFVVRNSTIAANNAPAGSGGNLWTDTFDTQFENSIVADGSAAANPDIATGTGGGISSLFSLIESPGATPFTDIAGTITGDPQLGPLANNGGPTLTKRQADTSPVVNTGDPAFVPPPTTDQRGFPRVVGGRIDMGAVEIVRPGVFTVSPASVVVDENGGSVMFTVSRTGGTDGAVTVGYSTFDGTAIAGSDYVAGSGTLAFADGDGTPQIITIPILDDTVAELTENFQFALASPTGGATLGSPSGAPVSIADDERGTFEFNAPTYTVAEDGGSVTLTVNRVNGLSGSVAVDVAVTGGNATGGGTDYTFAGTTLTWADGETGPKSFTILISNDGLAEGDETINLALASPTGGAALGTQSMTVVTIIDSGVGADLEITKSGPASVAPGSAVAYNVLIKNLGPSGASGVVVDDSFSAGLIYESTTTPCGGGFPCTIGNIASGSSVSFTVNFTAVPPGQTSSLTNSASVSATTFDPAGSNNSSSATTAVCAATAPTLVDPAEGATIPSNPVTFRFNTTPATASYQLYAVGSSSPAPIFLGSTTTGTLTADVPTGPVTWYVDAIPFNPNCGSRTSERGNFTLTGCPVVAPQLLSPSEGSVVSFNPVAFRWTAVAGADGGYKVFYFQSGFTTPQLLGQTTDTSLIVDVPQGAIEWYVEPIGPADTCAGVASARGHFTQSSCASAAPSKAPEPAIPGESTSTETYEFSWTFEGPDDTTFEVQESLDDTFATLVSPPRLVTVKKAAFVHDVALPAGYFYKVRAVRSCNGQSLEGPFSVPVRIVVLPPPPPAQNQPDQTQQFGLPDTLIQTIFIPGDDATARSGLESLGNTGKPITVTTSQPWLTASPVSVTVPPQGVVITVTAVPVTLPVGTNTGTVLVTTPSPTGGAVPITNTPISVNLVTPVTPTGKVGAPPQNALVIPSVSHVDGINASYQSDVRIANLSSQKVSYQVSFTPSRVDGTTTGRQTLINIEPGATTALDDVVKRLYGFGSLGDGVLGSLEIRPLNLNASGLTVASSRTYNNKGVAGSLSQFVPSVPMSSFVFKGTGPSQQTILSMQQIAQTSDFRTSLGIVEGSGESATAQVTIFGIDGQQLDTFFLTLKPAEHVQIGNVLATRGINNLSDGRIEVQLTSDTGRITAFATVIDSRSGDPLLVPGVQLSKIGASRYVVPGVTHISNDRNQWRSEIRIFNASSAPETATLTFIPANNPAGATSSSISIAPGEVKPIDNVVESVFGLTNIVGAIHVTTPAQSSLVVTSRTFDSKLGGQVGQFTQAVTAAEANGLGDRALQVLQLEESDRFRTNLGVAEVTGNSVEVEITAVVPDARVAPVIRLTLQPNEFRQIGSILRQMGLNEAYNARLSLKVLAGDGRITAYGSVIDSVTQDPYTVKGQ